MAAVAVAGGLAGFIILSRGEDGGGPGPPKKSKREVGLAQVRFDVVGAGHILEGKSPGAPGFDREKKALTAMFTDVYQRSFVTSAKAQKLLLPAVARRYTEDAKKAFTLHINSLTIGNQSGAVARVVPRVARLNLRIYFDPGARPTFAVVKVHFRAQVTMVSQGQADLEQFATYRLQKVGPAWLITSFDARLNQEPVAPSSSPSPAGVAS